jgi:hypothetical protein
MSIPFKGLLLYFLLPAVLSPLARYLKRFLF